MAQRPTGAYPVEDFLQALGSQLDRAQDALALKVTGTKRPLTWALKDLTIDLRVFVDVGEHGKVMLRSAGPNEDGASTMHLNFTTITRPMVEENSYAYHQDLDPRSIAEFGSAANLDENEQRKLEWMGVRTVSQLRALDPQAVQAIVGIPVSKMQAALAASARPTVYAHEASLNAEGASILKIHGANLTSGVTPEVKLAGDIVEVLEASPRTLTVRPRESHDEGQIEVFTDGQRATGYFRLPKRTNGANGSAGANGVT